MNTENTQKLILEAIDRVVVKIGTAVVDDYTPSSVVENLVDSFVKLRASDSGERLLFEAIERADDELCTEEAPAETLAPAAPARRGRKKAAAAEVPAEPPAPEPEPQPVVPEEVLGTTEPEPEKPAEVPTPVLEPIAPEFTAAEVRKIYTDVRATVSEKGGDLGEAHKAFIAKMEEATGSKSVADVKDDKLSALHAAWTELAKNY